MGKTTTTTQQLTAAPQSQFGEFLEGGGGGLTPTQQRQLDQAREGIRSLPRGGSARREAEAKIAQAEAKFLQQNRAEAGPGFLQQNFQQLAGIVGEGPGQQDVLADLEARRSAAERGGLAGEADITAARGFTEQLLAPQRIAQQQAFEQQLTQANQQAALTGRGANDPILRNRLAQEQLRSQERLGAQQTALTAQVGQQAAQQRLNLLGGLATQALQNRQILSQLGSGLLGQERAFRLATGRNVQTTEESASIGDIIGGIGSAVGIGGQLFGGGGGGGGGAPAPSPAGSSAAAVGGGANLGQVQQLAATSPFVAGPARGAFGGPQINVPQGGGQDFFLQGGVTGGGRQGRLF